ncbi:MAG: 50S ribosomal protein L11 methyltransferase [Bacteroidales bacterium]|nr:50S ribosomal protein L11 methyltransferase [Bacteroidales bacterium]
MNTVELHCIIHADKYEKQNISDILLAQLSELGFYAFQNIPEGLKAYIAENNFDFEEVRNLPLLYIYPDYIEFHTQIIEEKNWNKEWEKNFKPVRIGNDILVRAPFHDKVENFRYEIVIEPKMSFGTGHHSTTILMMESVLELGLAGKKVLDMGCGTGILAILASKRGAEEVWAVDNNEWAWQNSRENAEMNNIPNIKILQGTARDIETYQFDIILANINLNTLLEDLPVYSNCLPDKGELILSGIYRGDMKKIEKKSNQYGLYYVTHKERNLWVAMKLKKNVSA